MSSEESTTKTVVAAVSKLVDVLSPLSADGRQRAIASAMMVFGEAPPAAKLSSMSNNIAPEADAASKPDGISAKAALWMKKNGLTIEHLGHVFSIERGEIDVIAARLPGKSKRQQTLDAYLLCGLAAFLKNGELDFLDADARKLCTTTGCYDRPNHAVYIKQFKNLIVRSKDSNWRLTNPGLGEGAKIIKQLGAEASE